MNAQHTPGPWEIAVENPHCILAPAECGLCIVATLPKEGSQKPDTNANARLIAAAPELLAALIQLLEERTAADHLIRLLEDAEVFDAKGQPTPCTSPASTAARAAISLATGGAQ